MQNLFLGGWDGHRLDLVNDTSIEPGVTPIDEVTHDLSLLSAKDYAVIFIDKAKLTPEEATPHGLFCDAPTCLAVLDRHGGEDFRSWGPAVAIFEFTGPKAAVAGAVWMDGSVVRPPGPRTWPMQCKAASEQPRFVHADGMAVFPVRPSPSGEGFAQFGPSDLTAAYKRDGYPAPNTTSCVVEPLIPDQPAKALTPASTTKPAEPGNDHPRRKKKKKEEGE
jgi:hypothetical protein